MTTRFEIREALAAVWDERMDDSNGEHVASAFVQTLAEVKQARLAGTPFEPFEFHNRVLGSTFEVMDGPDSGVWLAVASNVVSDMAVEFKRIITAAREQAAPAK
jgi:hypothetical protein